jgi:hypothetical protein
MDITLLPTRAPLSERISHRPYLILAALQLADVATTGWLLSRIAGTAEANPIVAAIFSTTGLTVGLAILLALKLAVVYAMWTFQTKMRIATAIYSAVVFNNLLILFGWLSI